MKKRSLFVFAFFILTGFNDRDRIVEQSGVNLQERFDEGVAPSFPSKPVIRLSDDGTKLCIEARILADPKPEITWFRNSSELIKSQKYKIYLTEAGDRIYIAVLEINNVSSEDAGNYRVRAKNKLGKASAGRDVGFNNQ